MRPPVLRLHTDELIIDSFAGGGGASTGIEWALGRSPDIAVARSDGRPIVWPEATHGKGRIPFRTAAECIDWTIPCPSIFDRKRPLAENTLRRIARGLRRYVIEAAEPFIVSNMTNNVPRPVSEPVTTILTGNHKFLVAPTLVQTSWGERKGQAPRCLDLHKPLGTIMAGGVKHALVAAFLAKHYGGNEGRGASGMAEAVDTVTARDHHSLVACHLQRDFGQSVGSALDAPVGAITGGGGGHAALVASHLLKLRGGLDDHDVTAQDLRAPTPTITAGGTHLAEVRAFLLSYYGSPVDAQLGLPLHTITTKHRFGLVTVHGQDYVIADIGMRMLEPHELFAAQSFPPGYVIAPEVDGSPLTKTAQVRMCGNAVPPVMSEAIVRAQFTEQAAAEVA